MFNFLLLHLNQTLRNLFAHRHTRNLSLLILALLIAIAYTAGGSIVLVLVSGIIAIVFSQFEIDWAGEYKASRPEAQAIHDAIERGVVHYRHFQGRAILLGCSVLFIMMLLLMSWTGALAFLVGALVASGTAYLSIVLVEVTHTHTAEVAYKGSKAAFKVAFQGGASAGLLVAGIGLTGTALFLAWLIAFEIQEPLKAMLGFALGSSLVSMVNRLSSVIFSIGADIGTDIAIKNSRGNEESRLMIPIKSRGIIKNIKACAGLSADLFETFVITLIATMLLTGNLTDQHADAIIYPLMLTGVALIASVIGAACVNLVSIGQPLSALYRGLLISGIIAAILFYPVTRLMLGDHILINQVMLGSNRIYLCALVGLLLTAAIIRLAEFFSSHQHVPVKQMAEVYRTGISTFLNTTSIRLSSLATVCYVSAICTALVIAYLLAGVYGIAIAGSAMVSMAGLIIAIYIYGPIIGNAGRLAQMIKMPETIHQITIPLNTAGNTSRAISKAYAISATAFTSLLIFINFEALLSDGLRMDLTHPSVMLAVLIGALTPYAFTVLTMNAIINTAGHFVKRTQRWMRSQKSTDTLEKHDDLITNEMSSQVFRDMITPALLPLFVPAIIGWLLGASALGGYLVGAMITGIFNGIALTMAGIALSNTQNESRYDHKEDEKQVTISTLGDSFKNAAGPAMGPLLKMLHLVALLILPLLQVG